jgi:uncharacterized Zn finger protein
MKYYVPMRCPNCGEIEFSVIKRPPFEECDKKVITVLKWVQCNMCMEVFPLPRQHIIKE